jgi:hypothetical protein
MNRPPLWIGLVLLVLGLLMVHYGASYLLCLNAQFHNILAYQYADVPTYCRQVTLFPFSLLF